MSQNSEESVLDELNREFYSRLRMKDGSPCNDKVYMAEYAIENFVKDAKGHVEDFMDFGEDVAPAVIDYMIEVGVFNIEALKDFSLTSAKDSGVGRMKFSPYLEQNDPNLENEHLKKYGAKSPGVEVSELQSGRKREDIEAHIEEFKSKHPEKKGKPFLHSAIKEGDMVAFNHFLSQAKDEDLNVADRFGSTPLHYASSFGGGEMVEKLLDHNASIIVKDPHKQNALHYACIHNNKEAAKVLIQNLPELAFEGKYEGETPIGTAIGYGHTDIALAIIDELPDEGLKSRAYSDSLKYAVEKSQYKAIEVLVKNGADQSEVPDEVMEKIRRNQKAKADSVAIAAGESEVSPATTKQEKAKARPEGKKSNKLGRVKSRAYKIAKAAFKNIFSGNRSKNGTSKKVDPPGQSQV